MASVVSFLAGDTPFQIERTLGLSLPLSKMETMTFILPVGEEH